MAADAVLLENAGDVAMVGHRLRRERGCAGLGQIQFATGSGGGLDLGPLSLDEGRDGIGEIAMAGFVETVVDAVLVVEGAPVNQGARRVEEEDLGGAARTESGGESAVGIVDVGRGEVVPLDLGRDLFSRLARQGVDEKQGKSLIVEFLLQDGETRQIAFAERAGGAGHGHDEALPPLPVGNSKGLP